MQREGGRDSLYGAGRSRPTLTRARTQPLNSGASFAGRSQLGPASGSLVAFPQISVTEPNARVSRPVVPELSSLSCFQTRTSVTSKQGEGLAGQANLDSDDSSAYEEMVTHTLSGTPKRLGNPKDFSSRPRRRCHDTLVRVSRRLCNSWHFSALTTALTIYALFGDDFRLATTHKRLDLMFDVLTIICILVFCVEINVCSLGQDGYFLGFFFLLDFICTLTLVMDLSWIANALFCSSVEDSSSLRTARAGRAGARAGRTVRIIRLIRLAKLYKTYKAATEQKEDMHRRDSSVAPGERDDDDMDDDDDDDEEHEHDHVHHGHHGQNSETRVGKKLGDMTTRRVIILVLVMLFAMPQFVPASHGIMDFRSSAYMGMEMVYERWRQWCPVNTTHSQMPWCLQWDGAFLNEATIASRAEERHWYESYMLNYLYSHRSDGFAWKLHWIGFNSTTLVDEFQRKEGLPRQDAIDKALLHLQRVSQLGQTRFLNRHLLPPKSWDSLFANEQWQIPIHSLPNEIRERLADVWEEKCNEDFIGVPLTLSHLEGKNPSLCSIVEDLRCSEFEYFIPLGLSKDEEMNIMMLFAFDKRRETQLEAALSMLQTVFICLAVGFGAMTFSNDANQLLLNPIERMVRKMETIKDNPLEAMRLGDFEYRREQIEASKWQQELARKNRFAKMIARAQHSKKVKEPMETVILEKTIIKLGGLLALGFGEAGAEIIGANMRGGHSASVDAMVPGQKVDAIIGFCNIRHFTEATECLKEKVLLFVNQVGEIVHGCVDDYLGAPNKNVGDAFLLIWRLSGVPVGRQTKLADMALMSFVRIIVAMNTSPVLAEYRKHPGMQQRVKNFRVQMGFGLHCGWAVEGAIGSEFKIDASYLSPNVNVATVLQAATEEYGVFVLVSHFMIGLCSLELAKMCRLIDHVLVKGSKQPTRLYTLDLDYTKLEIFHRSMDRMIKNRFKLRQVRELRKQDKWADEFQVTEAFSTDEDLLSMRQLYTSEFFERFAMAYRNYEAGQWMVARDMFFTCHYAGKTGMRTVSVVTEETWPIDGPSRSLLNFMSEEGYAAPPDWPGHRVLAEK